MPRSWGSTETREFGIKVRVSVPPKENTELTFRAIVLRQSEKRNSSIHSDLTDFNFTHINVTRLIQNFRASGSPEAYWLTKEEEVLRFTQMNEFSSLGHNLRLASMQYE